MTNTPNLPTGKTSILGKVGNLLTWLATNIKWVIVFIVLLFAMGVATKCSIDNSWNAKYAAYKAHADSVAKQYTDSVNKVIAAHKARADSQTAIANALTKRHHTMTATIAKQDSINKKLADSLAKLNADLVPGEPVAYSTYLLCTDLTHWLQREVDSLKIDIVVLDARDLARLATIAQKDSIIRIDSLAIDTLKKTILSSPKPQSPSRLFGIFKITPTQAFIGGAIISAVTLFIFRGKL